MSQLISPKDLARAIGVSESSMKRWADEGLLIASRTAGGHRRIALPEAVRFIRQLGACVVHPAALGMADLEAAQARDAVHGADVEALYAAVELGDAVAARAIIQTMYLNGTSVAAVCDGPVRECLMRVGELWLHQDWGIVVEHRATDICVQAVSQLRWMLPPPGEDAPVAVGGAAEADPYTLPSLMAATVACEAGFRDVNLGACTPVRVLVGAAERYQARLAWIAVSSVTDARRLRDEIVEGVGRLRGAGVAVAAGGRGWGELGQFHVQGLTRVGSMTEFAAYAKGLLAAWSGARSGARS